MAAIISDDRHRTLGALIVRPRRLSTARRGLGHLSRLASVVLGELVGQFDAAVEGQHGVVDAVDGEVSDGVGAPVAATDDAAAEDADGAEGAGAGAGQRVAHAAAPAEARGEAGGLVDAEVGLDLLDDGVDEGDVLAAVVGPAGVAAVGSDEDGAALGASRQPVPGLDTRAVDDVVHVAAAPVEAKDELMGFARVVSLGHLEDVFAIIDVVDAVGQGGLFAATGGVGCMGGGEEAQGESWKDGTNHGV